jgi:hypothetical protein
MKFLNIFAVTLVIFSSCQRQKSVESIDKPISLTGKWHRFSMANGYSEFAIDSHNVVFYNQKVGRFKLPYKIEKDSLKYLTMHYAAKITDFGDSVRLEGNDNTTATLHRFKDGELPFHHIPEEKDSVIFASYIKGFDQRLISEFQKAGIEITDNAKKPDDMDYQQLLKEKNN